MVSRQQQPSLVQEAAARPPQLSCELCRDRKVKCDKLDPCSNCESAGVTCVPIYRHRLPRGRHAHPARTRSSPTLASNSRTKKKPSVTSEPAESSGASSIGEDDRLNQARSASDTMVNGYSLPQPTASWHSSRANGAEMHLPRNALNASISHNRYSSTSNTDDSDRELGGCFWSDLVGEVNEQSDANSSSRQSNRLHTDMLRCLGLNNSLATSFKPSTDIRESQGADVSQLCHIYLQQVDPIIKILHRPSLMDWLVKGEGYLSYPSDHPSLTALRSAVCYTAAVSMTAEQSLATFSVDRNSMVAKYRNMTEQALEWSSLLETEDITVLQAFVLYLVAQRSEGKGKAVWTMLALAVRIAMNICLEYGSPAVSPSKTPFEIQMQARLWLTLCLIDFQTAKSTSRGSLISDVQAAFYLDQVRHVDDRDFGPLSKMEPEDQNRLTDATFAIVTYNAQLVGRRLAVSTLPRHGDTTRQRSAADCNSRLLQGQHFERKALALLNFCDPRSSSFAWFVWHATQSIVSTTRFLALQLIHAEQQHQNQSSAVSQGSSSGINARNTELLRMALQALSKTQAILLHPRGNSFRWYVTIPWQALGTVVDMFAQCGTVDASLFRSALPLIEAMFVHDETSVADCTAAGGDERRTLREAWQRVKQRLWDASGTITATSTTASIGLSAATSKVGMVDTPTQARPTSSTSTAAGHMTTPIPTAPIADMGFGKTHLSSSPPISTSTTTATVAAILPPAPPPTTSSSRTSSFFDRPSTSTTATNLSSLVDDLSMFSSSSSSTFYNPPTTAYFFDDSTIPATIVPAPTSTGLANPHVPDSTSSSSPSAFYFDDAEMESFARTFSHETFEYDTIHDNKTAATNLALPSFLEDCFGDSFHGNHGAAASMDFDLIMGDVCL